MRPHHLTIANIGPFTDEISVDFDELGEEGLFLIHGKTGSGKTFLLDAMTFALFGEIPDGRDKNSLVSHLAEPGSRPSVVLEFTAAGDRYRVERWPAHLRPKERGTGLTDEKAGLRLVRIATDGSEIDVPGETADHNAAIRDAVGLDAKQFRRVILLPQGEFAKFLKSDDREREGILTTLFDTALYQELAERLKKRASDASDQVANLTGEVTTLGIQARDRWNEFVGGLGDDHPYEEITDESLTAAAFADLVDRIAAATTAAAEIADAALESLRAAQEAHQKATDEAKLWDRRQRALEVRDRLAEQSGEMTEIEARLADHDRARPVEPHLTALADAAERRATLGSRTADVLEQVRSTSAGAVLLPPAFRDLDLTDLPARSALDPIPVALADARNELEGLATAAERAGTLEQSAEKHRATARRLKDEGEEATTEANRLTEERTARAAERDRAAETAGGLAAAELRQKAAQTAVEAHEKLRKATADLTEKEARAEAADTAVRAAERTLEELRLRKLANLSAALAATLTDGDACPVCGSQEHPEPARPADDDASDAEIEAAEQQFAGRKADAVGARGKADQAQGMVTSLAEAVGDTTMEDAAAELAAAKSDIANAASAEQAATTARKRLEAIGARLTELEGLGRDRAARITEAETLAKTTTDEATTLREKVRAALGDDADPAAAVTQMLKVAAALDDVMTHRRDLDDADTAVAERSNALADALTTATFPDVDAARAALLPADEAAQLGQRLGQHKEGLTANQAELTALADHEIPEHKPDTEATERAAEAARKASDAAMKSHDRAHTAEQAIRGNHGMFVEREAELAGRRSEVAVLQNVAKRCNGSDGSRVSLQRWVLGRHLDEICERANRRLATMTSGRYRLDRKENPETARELSGLGLEIFDTSSDLPREVNTLSGGETFQTSLALALGLADVVQDRAGGRRLEALFVDEGFGTLDEDTLHVCMNELESLREGGRLVGMVSHVTEVKERIRYGVEVTWSASGSTVQVGPTNPA